MPRSQVTISHLILRSLLLAIQLADVSSPEQMDPLMMFCNSSRMFLLKANTEVLVESCFEYAEKFITERRDTRPEMIKDRRAFNPFNLGLFTLYRHI